MLVALTGASGLVGSYTAQSLSQAGHPVRALVRPVSRRDHIEPFVNQWCEGDYYDPQTAAALVAGVDVVIHAAVDWDAQRRSPITGFERNLLGSLRLLEASRLAGVGQFIFVSSVAVYHTILNEPDASVDESHPCWPASTYGAYKAAVEPYLLAYHNEYGMNTSAWRPAAIYGVHPILKKSLWYDIVDSVRHDQQVNTTQGGKITHVQDVADALVCAVGDSQVSGRLFNLVDQYLYWQSVAEYAREQSGKPLLNEPLPGSGPKNQFDCSAARAFFDRHGKPRALRRGVEGVRSYVSQLMQRMDLDKEN